MRQERLGDLEVIITGGTDGRGGGHGPVVVLLHGFGAPGDDLVPLAGMLPVPGPARFVFPAAPLDLSSGPMAFFGQARAWWMIDMERIQSLMLSGRQIELVDEVPEGVDAARERVLAMLDALVARLDADPARMVLGGFSQGAMLSCDIALRTDRPLAGLVLLSGTLLAASEWLPRMRGRAGLRVFQSHGRSDPILSFALAERLRDHLSAAGLKVAWHAFPGGHEIPPPVLHALGGFLGQVLQGG